MYIYTYMYVCMYVCMYVYGGWTGGGGSKPPGLLN